MTRRRTAYLTAAVVLAGVLAMLAAMSARAGVIFCDRETGECANNLTIVDMATGQSIVVSAELIFTEGFE